MPNQVTLKGQQWRDELPYVDVKVKTVKFEATESQDELSFLRNRMCVTINEGDIQFVISKFLAGLIKPGFRYRFWYLFPDGHFRRYFEVMSLENMDD